MSGADSALLLEVSTDAFRGPIELLLELVTSRKLEVSAVSISQVVDDFVAAVETMRHVDLGTASKFLLVAATLIHLKTSRLLPGGAEIELDDDLLADAERDILVARLLAARTFKDVADVLNSYLETGSRYVARAVQPGDHVRHVAPDLLRQISPADLARLAAQALAARPDAAPQPLDHVEPVRATVRGAIVELTRILAEAGQMSFSELTEGVGLLDAVVRFLGILELLKAGAVSAWQDVCFGDIRVEWICPPDLADVLTLQEWDDADEAAAVDAFGTLVAAEAAREAGS